ncbi:MAG: iron-containing alcohol dehydrogenase [Pseudomonadota bacterium]
MSISFSLARLPRIEFGPGLLAQAPVLAAGYGPRVLVVTGARSFVEGTHWATLQAGLREQGLAWDCLQVPGEPSPELVDGAVAAHRQGGYTCVLGVGGGSALDAAKAIAGLLVPGNSVLDHLEGVGPELPYRGPAVPFIAVPTTAGTGSEATKNAVLSRHGAHGFKKSFRDDKLVAEHAILDPDLLSGCPPRVLAANGMDAFTQLLESYVSAKANPLTDALAVSGMVRVRDALLPWYEGSGDPAPHRAAMAYGALLSGITLAQVGLGSVHGLAAPLGAFFPIPHGVACGTLVAEASRVNIRALRQRAADHSSLRKYADAGRLLASESLSDAEALAALPEILDDWTRRLDLPRLGAYGMTEADVARVVANSRGSSMKTNPVVLTDEEIAGLVRARL